MSNVDYSVVPAQRRAAAGNMAGQGSFIFSIRVCIICGGSPPPPPRALCVIMASSHFLYIQFKYRVSQMMETQ